MRCLLPLALLAVAVSAHAQFVYPKPSDNVQKRPGTYHEDPFITEYRQKFFAALRGDFKTFDAAYDEIEAMVKKDPQDARALVWLGNGQTIKAIRANLLGQKAEARTLMAESRKNVDSAVALQPKNYNIYMMRATTLYAQAQYAPDIPVPRSNWEHIRDDCNALIKEMGPRIEGASTHVEGEAYGELGIAYLKLGEKEKARGAFEKILVLTPGSAYAERAKKSSPPYNSRVSVPLPDLNHPRPLMTRERWRDLSGEWEFAFDDAKVGLKERWFGQASFPLRIQVPFAYQWPLSGIGDPSIHKVVWYGLTFEPTGAERAEDLLLHFGAVDYDSHVWLNGREIGGNRGGNVPFSFDLNPYLEPGPNRLVLRVEDSQSREQPRGKQAYNGIPKSCDYWCTTGIWQRVWLEPAPARRVESLTIVPRLDPDRLEVEVRLHAHAADYRIEIEGAGDVQSFRTKGTAAVRFTLAMPEGARWTPESPTLHGLRVRLFEGDESLDEVHTYAGLRDIRIEGNRFLLNGEPRFLSLVLDQGYWPDGGLTPPSLEALRTDVELTKAMGFNGARKHQKVEDPRWLTLCDRLGLLVWGEMANARAWSFEAEERFEAEWERSVRRDMGHPCVVTWVPINESWGVPDLGDPDGPQIAFLERLVALTRRLDPTRPVIDNDGWEHTDVSDIAAIHDYTPTGDGLRARWSGGRFPNRVWGKGKLAHYVGDAEYRGQPIVLSEVGGFLLIPEAADALDPLYKAYGSHRTAEELLAKYRDIMRAIADVGVAGFCYTQLTDVMQEINGLLTFDRVPKVPVEEIAKIHRECFGG